jgi:hypothetical protein
LIKKPFRQNNYALIGAVMKKAALAVTPIFVLLVSIMTGVFLVELVTANPVPPEFLPFITINSNGTVTPETEFITQNGSIYTLTANISQEYTIAIECSNIVFDGAGHSINCSKGGYSNTGVSLMRVTNVTVQDIEVVSDNYRAIYLRSCSNCTILGVNTAEKDVYLLYSNFSTIAESNIAIGLDSSNDNRIFRNNITEMHIAGFELDVYGCNSNIFYENNIYCTNLSLTLEAPASSYLFDSANFWDNGSIGNYWSNYLTKYPTAKEIGNSGIGDISYIIDSNNIDNYPLMEPIAVPDFPDGTGETVPFPTTLVITTSVIIAVVCIGLVVYIKKLKSEGKPS